MQKEKGKLVMEGRRRAGPSPSYNLSCFKYTPYILCNDEQP